MMYASNSFQNMSNDLPPFVSNTPPPLSHNDLVEDSDDDIGNFSTAYESYDSPKKKTPDLSNVIEQDIIPSNLRIKENQSSILPSQELLDDLDIHLITNVVTNHVDHNTSITQHNHLINGENVNFIEKIHLTKYLETQSVSHHSNNLEQSNIQPNNNECTYVDRGNDVSTVINENSSLTPLGGDNFIIQDKSCIVETLSNDEANSTNVNVDFSSDIEQNVPLSHTSHTNLHKMSNNEIANAIICNTNVKPNMKSNKGISNEIMKFLENEKHIDNEFNNFESKFHSLNHNTEKLNISPDTPPSSPHFVPQLELSKSFNDFDDEEEDDVEEFGNFQDFDSNIKSSESMEFGDFTSNNVLIPNKNNNIISCDESRKDVITASELSTDSTNYSNSINVIKNPISLDTTNESYYCNDNLVADNINVNQQSQDNSDVISTNDIKIEFNDNEQINCDNVDNKSDIYCKDIATTDCVSPIDIDEIQIEEKDFNDDFVDIDDVPSSIMYKNECTSFNERFSPLNQSSRYDSPEFSNLEVESGTGEVIESFELSCNTEKKNNSNNEFGEFDNVNNTTSEDKILYEQLSNGNISFGNITDSFGDFSRFDNPASTVEQQEEEDDDDFGNFSCVSISESKQCVTLTAHEVENNDGDQEDDDFGDFTSTHELRVSNDTIEYKSFDVNTFDTMDIFENYHKNIPECQVIPLDTILQHSEPWIQMKEIEKTPALSYQWTNSESNRALLLSLKIDTRNIIFGPRWKENVPRFAANLGYSPLEPSKPPDLTLDSLPLEDSPKYSPPLPTVSESLRQEHVPDPHFDWSGSGLTNPLDNFPKSSRETIEEEFSQSCSTLGTPQDVLKPMNSKPLPKCIPSTNESSINFHLRVTANIHANPEVLKEDLEKLINELPDLSFMLAQNVLKSKDNFSKN